jgi:hypothetical protein
VRFEHPNAPTERRTVKLAPGETLLVDVTLKLAPPAPEAASATPIPGVDAGGQDDSP